MNFSLVNLLTLKKKNSDGIFLGSRVSITLVFSELKNAQLLYYYFLELFMFI